MTNMPSFARKLKDKIEAKKRNHQINKQIHLEKKTLRNVRVAPIYGIPGSVKSTIFDRIRLINGYKYDEVTRIQKRDDIRKFIIDTLRNILNAIHSVCPPLLLNSLQNEAMARILLSCWVNKPEMFENKLPDGFNLLHFIKTLFQDKSTQEAINRSELCETGHYIKYFLNRIDTIYEFDYVPTDEDILRLPVQSTQPFALREVHFQLRNRIYRFIDVVNMNTLSVKQSKKLLYFLFHRHDDDDDDVDGIFTVDCSSYDLISDKDPVKNRLRESLTLLEDILRAGRICRIFVILDKQDLFEKKLLTGNKFEDYFPEIEYVTSEEDNNHYKVTEANKFITDRVEQIFDDIRQKRLGDSPNFHYCSIGDECSENDVEEFLDQYYRCMVLWGLLE